MIIIAAKGSLVDPWCPKDQAYHIMHPWDQPGLGILRVTQHCWALLSTAGGFWMLFITAECIWVFLMPKCLSKLALKCILTIAFELSVVSPYLNWEKYSATSAYLRALLDASREIISRRADWAGAVAWARLRTVRLQTVQRLWSN